MDEEIWKVIPDWPEYEVSDHGRVRRKIGGNGCTPGYILKPYFSKKWGRVTVNLCRNAKIKVSRVHRLVAAAFLDGDKNLLVCHWDGNPQNNHVSNLRYDTNKANSADTIRHGRTPRGEKNGHNRYKEDTIRSLKEKIKEGVSASDCSRIFGIPVRYIYTINCGKYWGWLK